MPSLEWPARSLIEIEAQPKTPFAARDWGELLIARQLALPLFRELPGRRIASDLFDRVDRVDRCTWRLRIAETARWSDSRPVTSGDICRQLATAARSTGSGALTGRIINRLTASSPRELSITTWLPVGEIGRVLTSPAFGPVRGPMWTSGAFTAGATRPESIRLRHVSGRHSIDAASGLDVTTLRQAAVEGTLAASSLLTGCLAGTGLPGYAITEADLDILVCLQLPSRLRLSHSHMLSRAIDRARIARVTHGLVRPVTSAADLWPDGDPAGPFGDQPGSARRDGPRIERDWFLDFTDFHPNAIVAADVASQLGDRLGLNVTPRRVAYEEFVAPGQVTTVRLALIAATWAHPAALIAPCLTRAEIRDGRLASDFAKSCRDSIAAEDTAAAACLAGRALRASGHVPAFIVVGRLRSQILHRVGRCPWIPPSGWFDFSDFLPAADTEELRHASESY